MNTKESEQQTANNLAQSASLTGRLKAGLLTQFCDPAPLRAHPLHGFLPAPDVAGAEWHAFVDACSAAGPEGLPAILVTPEGLIMDGERRWRAAVQLQWTQIKYETRPEWEAALIMIESLLGQRCLSKGAKVYLSLPLMPEYSKQAESRRLMWLRKGVKILQKPNVSPLPYSIGRREASRDLAERLGVERHIVEQAISIRKYFESPELRERKFRFQDGSEKTLKEHFEPQILDGESPIGLGACIAGIGSMVKGGDYAPPPPQSRLGRLTAWWGGSVKSAALWEELSEEERKQAAAEIDKVMVEWTPGYLRQVGVALRRAKKVVGKRSRRAESKEAA